MNDVVVEGGGACCRPSWIKQGRRRVEDMAGCTWRYLILTCVPLYIIPWWCWLPFISSQPGSQSGIHKELDPEIMCKSSYEWMNDVSSGSYKPWEIKLKSFIRGFKSVQCSWTWVGRWTMMSWTKEGIASMMMTQLITNRTTVIHFNFTDKERGDKVLDKGGWMKR